MRSCWPLLCIFCTSFVSFGLGAHQTRQNFNHNHNQNQNRNQSTATTNARGTTVLKHEVISAVFTLVNVTRDAFTCCEIVPRSCTCQVAHANAPAHRSCIEMIRDERKRTLQTSETDVDVFSRPCRVGFGSCFQKHQIMTCIFACAACARFHYTLAHYAASASTTSASNQHETENAWILTQHKMSCGPYQNTCAMNAAAQFSKGARFQGTYSTLNPLNVTIQVPNVQYAQV